MQIAQMRCAEHNLQGTIINLFAPLWVLGLVIEDAADWHTLLRPYGIPTHECLFKRWKCAQPDLVSEYILCFLVFFFYV